ncbi:MAG: hypothetical protein AUK34_11795 [Ignavibacteria bacterium CG2_30_36_16]|nr:CapA family protein [Ignavibacteria bacterium]OIP56150.1 MAG: hypothetical protein AUK34_11795 [Ignavibacteria bacterium CG2_30_36_16]PJB02113.1 MAG: capsular biosynthesis protein [Ignavibacteria bacterium CG_4_9_14_3_um_filter_36_18]
MNITSNLIIFLTAFCLTFFNLNNEKELIAFKENVNAEEKISTVKISAVGDLMCHSVQFKYANVEGDSFNFNNVYGIVKKYISSADFSFANFETVTAGKDKGYSGYPFFNSPDDFVTALSSAGFDLLTTSNNHSLDRGEFGVRRTIEIIKQNKINYNGTFLNEKDRDSVRIFDIGGIKIAMLAYSYGTNGIPVPAGEKYLINLIDFKLIKNDILVSKRIGAEIVLVHYHFGDEYKREPVQYQKDVVDKTLQAGADIIIGGHPHVVQPSIFFKTNGAKLDTGFAAYSLGNFVSNQRRRYSDAGVILNLYISKNFTTDSIYLSKVTFIPTYVFKGITDRGKEYIILPSELAYADSIPEYLTQSDILAMKQSFEDTREIMTMYNSKIKVESVLTRLSYYSTFKENVKPK